MKHRLGICLVYAFLMNITYIIAADVDLGNFSSSSLDGWTMSLGKEFPGAQGNLALSPETSPNGKNAAYMEAAFTDSGAYVAMTKNLKTPLPFKGITLKLKSNSLDSITVRLKDSESQTHQQLMRLKNLTEWQEVHIKSHYGEKYLSWGGVKDEKWHEPLVSVSILIEKSALKANEISGSFLISDITLKTE